MERDTNQMSQSATFCRSGCGFYGSPATDGLCSKCYKDALKRKQSNPATTAVTGRISPAASATTSEVSTSQTTASVTEDVLSTGSPTVPAVANSTQETKKYESSSSTETQTDAPVATSTQTDDPIATSVSTSTQDEVSDSASKTDVAEQKEQKKKNRCNTCRKKVGLTGFQCRCGGLFCSLHRYSNEHNCTFDYKQLGAQEIRKNNPLVVGEKIPKI